MTHSAYIGVGANLQDRLKQCKAAIDRIDGADGCRVSGVSPFYQTEPVGVNGQNWYVNAVIRVNTSLDPRPLLNRVLTIEADMGRIRETRWGPRVIDLDVLLFGNRVIKEEAMIIPHPRLHMRRFVLIPLVQLAPQMIHPVLGRTMMELLHEIPEDDQAVMEMGA